MPSPSCRATRLTAAPDSSCFKALLSPLSRRRAPLHRHFQSVSQNSPKTSRNLTTRKYLSYLLLYLKGFCVADHPVQFSANGAPMSKKTGEHDCACGKGLTRRGFLSTAGATTAMVAVGGRVNVNVAQAAATEITSEEMAKVTLEINGRPQRLLVEPRWTLLFVLRDRLGLTGTKVGCERGECGACTVLIDDEPRYACMLLAVEAVGKKIVTLEGLMNKEQLGTTQQAFLEQDAYQCGYCTPGQIMTAEGLLRANPNPTLDEIARGMSGNLCRCGAYTHIFEAVKAAAVNKRS